MIPMQLVLELLLLKDQVPDVLEVNHLVQVRFFSFSAPDRRICFPYGTVVPVILRLTLHVGTICEMRAVDFDMWGVLVCPVSG